MSGSFPSLNNMYGSGRNSSFVIQELNIQHLSFLKDKSPEFQYHNSSDLLISYPTITQTQIKHMLPTSFKFRVNSYIKTILSKTQENLRLKTRYLKGNTIEQLFIISILRDYLQSPFYFSALKNKLKQTRHTVFILFSFLDHTL